MCFKWWKKKKKVEATLDVGDASVNPKLVEAKVKQGSATSPFKAEMERQLKKKRKSPQE